MSVRTPVVCDGPLFVGMTSAWANQPLLILWVKIGAPLEAADLTHDDLVVDGQPAAPSPILLLDFDDDRLAPELRLVTSSEPRHAALFRAVLPLVDAEERPSRILTWLDQTRNTRTFEEVRGAAPRWRYCFASEPGRLDPGPTSEMEALVLQATRLELLADAPSIEPALRRDRYDVIAAELAAPGAKRGEVLARAGLGEWEWTLEEIAWLARIAQPGGGLGT